MAGVGTATAQIATRAPGAAAVPAPRTERAPLVLVSNRGGLEYRWDASGELVAAPGSGGGGTGPSALTRLIPRSVWISCAMSAADLAVARAAPGAGAARQQRARLLVPPPEEYQRYYGVFCNRFLWFLQHEMWDVLDPSDLAEALAD